MLNLRPELLKYPVDLEYSFINLKLKTENEKDKM